ncbi:MAG: hypothetical protein R3A78_06490 [Polyangiales bacterium]|nr:ABC transporter permease subunit [Myxococcales bacterium]
MALRDLGYKPYEGARLPATRNTWVLFRHGVGRAWNSWFVKVAVVFGWIPSASMVVFLAVTQGIKKMVVSQAPPGDATAAMPGALAPDFASSFLTMFGWQFWLFLTLVSLGAGATVIAKDLEFRAFRFYFAKPVEPWQYLLARTLGVGAWCFGLTWLPAVLYGVGASAVADDTAPLVLLLPATLYAVLVSVTVAVLSVAMSSVSTSRGVTMSLWLAFLLIPSILAMVASGMADFPWLRLASLPAILRILGTALFKAPTELAADPVHWYHALPVLLGFLGAGTALAWRRVVRAEVVT